MHFDDRLGTVLRQRTGGNAIARIQYRQLLDLLGTLPNEARGQQVDAAFDRLTELSAVIPAHARTAILREPGLRLRSARLVAELAHFEPQVAIAAIQQADLGTEQWQDLAPALPVHARSVMRSRRDLGPQVDRLLSRLGINDRGLPPADAVQATPEILPATEGIGALVKRIEDFRKSRLVTDGENLRSDSPRLPLGEEAAGLSRTPLGTFDFTTDGDGYITWAEPAMAPMTVGLRLVSRDAGSPSVPSPALVAAFRRRQPIRAGRVAIVGAPAIAGSWQVDAAPVFDSAAGRFTGYSGRMRRPAISAAATATAPAASEADRMRQLLHELRTPVNAIQGFAEVIQQQLFGPTPHEYRALAASIAGDAARILAGFEELERLARLDSGAVELEAGECDLAAAISATATQLKPFTAARGSGFILRMDDETLPVGLAPAGIERLAWRLLATLASASSPGEVLRLRARQRDSQARLTLQLPASLANRPGEELFHANAVAAPQALSAGMFGAGFTLRLARAEAMAAGGSLERRGDRLRLTLPLLTREPADNSQATAGAGAG